MISDYDRLSELVSSAQNSSGASQEQFEKTLDGIEVKLQQLKNAWDEFTMGILNSEVIKVGVDALTLLLEAINKATEGLNLGKEAVEEGTRELTEAEKQLNSWSNSLSKIAIIIAAFRIGKQIFNSLKNTFKELGKTAGEEVAKGVKEALGKGTTTTPTPSGDGDSPNSGKLAKVAEIGEIFSNVGAALMAVSVGINAVGEAFESWGYEGAAEFFEVLGKIASVLGTVGTLVGTFMQILPTITAAIKAIAAAIGGPLTLAIGALIVVLSGLLIGAYLNSPTYKLEKLKEAAEEAAEAADEANEAYNNLNDTLTSLTDKYESLEKLTTGTEDWNDAVIEINKEVLDLIEKYEELEKFVSVKNGVLTLDISSTGLQEIVKNYQRDWFSAQVASQQAKFVEKKEEDKTTLTESQEEYKQWQTNKNGEALQGLASSLDFYNSKEEEVQQQANLLAAAMATGTLQKEDFYFDEEAGRIMLDTTSDRYGLYYGVFNAFDSPFSSYSEEEQKQLFDYLQSIEKEYYGYYNKEYSDSALSTLLSGGLTLSNATSENKEILSDVLDKDRIAWIYEANGEDAEKTMNTIGTLAQSSESFVSSLVDATNPNYYSPEIWENIVKNDGLGLTSEQLAEFQRMAQQNPEAFENYFWTMPEEWRTYMFGNNLEKWTNWVKERTNNAENAFGSSRDILGGNLSGATATAQKGVANLLEGISGDNIAEIRGTASQIRAQGSTLSSENQTEFYSYLGSLYDSTNQTVKERQVWLDTISTVADNLGSESAETIRGILDQSEINYESDFLTSTMGLGQNFVSAYEKANDKAKWNKTLDSWYADYKIATSSSAKSYAELVSQAVDALTEEFNKQIEALEDFADDYAEVNEKLLSGIREIIDANRQARENEDTEQELTDMVNKMAYLAQDTSGASALDLLNAEKEYREAEQDYQDSLVDQSLEKLENANQIAQDQRDTQIDLLRDISSQPENFIEEATRLVDDAISAALNGESIKDTELGKLLTGVNTFFTEYDKTTFWQDVYEKITGAKKPSSDEEPPPTETKKSFAGTEDMKNMINAKLDLVRRTEDTSDVGLSSAYNSLRQYFRERNQESLFSQIFSYEDFVKMAKNGGYVRYATGGLADFTGPAWLDGTKTHPELVLNARDTENFILLKDILSKALNTNSSATAETGGETHFDIDINVDKIESDYDVEKMADKIRRLLYNDASYRNVNAVGLVR